MQNHGRFYGGSVCTGKRFRRALVIYIEYGSKLSVANILIRVMTRITGPWIFMQICAFVRAEIFVGVHRDGILTIEIPGVVNWDCTVDLPPSASILLESSRTPKDPRIFNSSLK